MPDLLRWALLAAGADPQARSKHVFPRLATWTNRPELAFLHDLRRWGTG